VIVRRSAIEGPRDNAGSRRKSGAAPRHRPGVEEVFFAGLRLLSLPGCVMAPRATSEQLVDAAHAHIGGRAARVADVGTGGGAIAIAIALACPSAEVWASDISRSAVLLARANVHRHLLTGRVRVCQGDLLAPLPGQFDVVVANLPYVPASSAADHPALADEPFDAVFAAGDGRGHYRRLLDVAAPRLASDGLLLLQIDRRVVAASSAELPALKAALGQPALLRRAA
jgi:release factor glutamine methyltransferase